MNDAITTEVIRHALLAAAEAWRPARGLAARLLWHHWRHVTGRPSFDDDPLPASAAPASAA